MHILTDIEWNHSFLEEFRRRYQADQSPLQDWDKAYYNDADQIDLELYRAWDRREEIWWALKSAEGCELPGILPKKAAELWNLRTLKWYEEPRVYEIPIRYMGMDEVAEFMACAGEKSASFIKKVLAKFRSV